jgi:hypothetical protein
MLALALLLAVTAPAQDRRVMVPGPEDSDSPARLTQLRKRCTTPAADEIAVCGKEEPQLGFFDLDPRFEPRPLRPTFATPGGGKGSVSAVQRGVGGVSVPAAMVTLRLPLGGKKKKHKP